MKKQLKYLFGFLLIAQNVFAQNIPNGTTTPAATYLKTIPPAYSNTPSNYSVVLSPIVPVNDSALVQLHTAVDSVQSAMNYTDGYGRTVETVMRQMSPAKKDVVSAPYYDEFGRSGTISYLPFTAVSGNTDDGLFKSNPFQQDSVFHKAMFPNDQVNYSQTVYDGSPFNMPVKVMGAGNEWGGAGIGKTFMHRSSKTSDSVRYWQIDMNSENDLPFSSGFYNAASLTVQQVTDENGVQMISYSDIGGHTILTKSQLASSHSSGNTGWLCTYYVYDEMGRLRSIIPPKASEALLANSWSFGSDSSVYKGLCYTYFYDKRGRQIEKYIPGKGKSFIAYDLADRAVMTQDPNLRTTSQWAFVLYDSSRRAYKTGLITPGIIRDSVMAQSARSMNYPALSGTYTVMTQSFYDDYDWLAGESNPLPDTMSTANINGTNFITSYNSSPLFAQQITQSKRIRGTATGSKILVLGTSDYLYSAVYYDRETRAVQTQSKNYSGGKDVMTVQYSFSGLALRRQSSHAKSGTNAQTHSALTKYSYDHAGRIISVTKNSDGKGDKIISSANYFETGQLQNKTLGSGLETQRFSYDIRGLLEGINKGYVDSAASVTAIFGEQLLYAHGFTNVQTNGLVAGVKWKNGGDRTARAYGYAYDNAGRLTQADFSQQNEGSTSWTKDLVDYTVTGLSYDAGGNIKSMNQKALLTGSNATIDSLSYSYFTNSNMLQKIADHSGNSSILGDFKDSTNTNDDYAYDANGNIVKDYNRHIYASGGNGALFNLLDKPDSIVIAGKSCTYYTYAASGETLKKRIKDYKNGTDLTYTYIGGYVYMNDTLQYAGMEEGRVRFRDSSGTVTAVYYDWFIKDHAGNIRSMVTDEQKLDIYPVVTMDSSTAQKNLENMFYAGLDATRVQKPAGYPSDPFSVPNSNNQLAMVQGNGNKVGPSITLKVMAGDTFNVRVSSYYKLNGATPNTPNPITDIVAALITGVSGSSSLNTHGVTSGEMTGGGAFSSISDFFTNQSSSYSGSTKPKAYLNYVLFDEQFKYVSSGSGFEQVGNDNTLTAITKTNMPVTKSGYLYIYVSNETPNVPVYFDNLQVSHQRGKLVETNEYYPYGMQMKNISYRAAGMMVNRYKSNGGSEFEDEGELNYTTTFYRKYDAQIGRFTGIDIYSEKFALVNPYQFGGNNPVLFSDPTGALMTTEQFKQVRDWNHLGAIDRLGGDWQEVGTSNWNSWDNPMDGFWGRGGGGSADGGSSGGIIGIVDQLSNSTFGGTWINNGNGTGTFSFFKSANDALKAGATYMTKYNLWGNKDYAKSETDLLTQIIKVIVVKSGVRGITDVGHTALQIGDNVFGFYPTSGNLGSLLWVKAKMNKNSREEFDKFYKEDGYTEFTLQVSDVQYNLINSEMESYIGNPGVYSLLGDQCTSVVANTILNAGVKLREFRISGQQRFNSRLTLDTPQTWLLTPNHFGDILRFPFNSGIVTNIKEF